MIGRWLMNKILDPLPVWLQVAIVLALFSPVAWNYVFPSEETAFVLHNHTERPISEAVLDDIWVGNSPAFNGYSTGSGVICCAELNKEKVDVRWRLSVTQNQYDSGVRGEDREKEVLIPDRRDDDFYLHVHIYPDNEVRLVWSETRQSELQVIRGKEAQDNVIGKSG
ncbi:DUF3304 domain-containing protein [Marinobacter sp. SS13-12]|uniref:DUF3304 domain-containing protein n=1 Tax=Marinobacter sp. SS13-12 TaxID=3050451 RepID=UPI0025531C38|nr:DUF3304 domain-containing protein [Marinobacter sp. SS13-12]MDK8464951.1 DUF3304 domain-containing protein [Marinobacter sp. SS13-12]